MRRRPPRSTTPDTHGPHTTTFRTNPSSSNEKIAKNHLDNDHITLYKNNGGIFNERAEGRADVFVTEAAEAEVQSKLNPKLCAVNPDKPLKYAEMGYLLRSEEHTLNSSH